jgi:hypothetical protein
LSLSNFIAEDKSTEATIRIEAFVTPEEAEKIQAVDHWEERMRKNYNIEQGKICCMRFLQYSHSQTGMWRKYGTLHKLHRALREC